MRWSTFTSVLVAATNFTCGAVAAQPKNSVLLSRVKSLTLRDGLKTSHRRVSAIPQLQCIGGNAKGLYNVDVMRCENSGSDYDDDNVQWTCKASIPDDFKLGSTDVICEGYSSPDDPYILKGSCGVEYRLILTEQGEAKFGRGKGRGGSYGGSSGDNETSTAFAVFFWILFVGVLLWMLYAFFRDRQTPTTHRPAYGRGYGGGGGGAGDDYSDPPPPYTTQSNNSFSSKSFPSSSQQSQSWRPGFWSGAAGGAAAGYFAGSRNGAARDRYRDDGSMFGRSNTGLFGSRNSLFGGRDNSYRNGGEGSSRSSYSPSGSSSSSVRHESTGFGTTSRR